MKSRSTYIIAAYPVSLENTIMEVKSAANDV